MVFSARNYIRIVLLENVNSLLYLRHIWCSLGKTEYRCPSYYVKSWPAAISCAGLSRFMANML